jgi:hypothetical protein
MLQRAYGIAWGQRFHCPGARGGLYQRPRQEAVRAMVMVVVVVMVMAMIVVMIMPVMFVWRIKFGVRHSVPHKFNWKK